MIPKESFERLEQIAFEHKMPERAALEIHRIKTLVAQTSGKITLRLLKIAEKAIVTPGWKNWAEIPTEELRRRARSNINRGEYLDALCLLAMIVQNERAE